MSSPTVYHRFSLTRSLLMIIVLFAMLLPVAAFAASAENEASGSAVRSDLPTIAPATFVVTTTDDSGAGSLRQAIIDANANLGADTITFAIGAVGSQQTITPASFLPIITDPVTIDGWSQGGAGYSGAPLIAIDGTFVSNADGLRLGAGSDGSVVRGLAIIEFAANGLGIDSSHNKIQGNYVGLGLDGMTAKGNGSFQTYGYPYYWAGIRVNGMDNLIGTDSDGLLDSAERNVVSGNIDGIRLSQTMSNVVAGNYIGTNASGLYGVPNMAAGIVVEGINNRIGTDGNGVADDLERNIISGNGTTGIALRNSMTTTIAGNYIGVNANGEPLGNGLPTSLGNDLGYNSGIILESSQYNIIGTDGSPDAFNVNERNVIAATGGSESASNDGIVLVSSSHNIIAGNYIGVNVEATATALYGNRHSGILLADFSNFNRIGTNADGVSDADEANLIGENGNALWLRQSMSNTVAGNLIGTDSTGMHDLGNSGGVVIQNSSYNLIGGAEPAARNLIRYTFDPDNGAGIVLWHDNKVSPDATSNNRIIGNSIDENRKDGIASFPTEYPSTPPGDGPADNFIISNTIGGNWENGIYNVGSSPLIQANFIVRNYRDGIRNEVYHGSVAGLDYVSRPDIVSNTIQYNDDNGIYNSGASPSIRTNWITFNALNGIDNIVDSDHLSMPDIFSNTIHDNCEPLILSGCAGIFSLDTAPNNASTLDTDNAPAHNGGYPFIEQRWYGAVEVIRDGVPIASSVVLSSANGGPAYTFSTTAGPCPAYNNTILHGGPGMSCDNESTWPAITQYIVDETGMRHNYMPVTSSSPDIAVYSFDANAATDPTDTGAGFVGEGIQTGPFSRYQIMQITMSDPISGLAALNDSPTLLGSPTYFTATVTNGTKITYAWDFGDGSMIVSGPSSSISHTYGAVGLYTAIVTATNTVSSVAATTPVTISDRPIFNLIAVNDSPTVLGSATHFTASASGSNITYTWDFRDGSPVVSGSSSSISHTYSAVGLYTAIVTATNTVSSVAATTSVTISDQPIFNLIAVNDGPTVLGSTTHFTATASGSNITYTWDFGDGSPVVSASSSVITHSYDTTGTYTTVVTAANSSSHVSAQTIVHVAPLPIANAGADQCLHTGQLAILNGGASLDPGGFLPLTYHWQQTGGQAVALSSANHMTVTFTTPPAVTQTITLTFALTVTNTLYFASKPDFVTVAVEPYRIYLPLALK